MNKKEQAAFEELHVRLALRFTEPLEPDVPPPGQSGNWNQLTTGWVFNSFNRKVDCACSSSVNHAVGSTTKTSTQQPRHLYSTRLLALKALRAVKEREYAEALRSIDLGIEAEEANPTPLPNTPAP